MLALLTLLADGADPVGGADAPELVVHGLARAAVQAGLGGARVHAQAALRCRGQGQKLENSHNNWKL